MMMPCNGKTGIALNIGFSFTQTDAHTGTCGVCDNFTLSFKLMMKEAETVVGRRRRRERRGRSDPQVFFLSEWQQTQQNFSFLESGDAWHTSDKVLNFLKSVTSRLDPPPPATVRGSRNLVGSKFYYCCRPPD